MTTNALSPQRPQTRTDEAARQRVLNECLDAVRRWESTPGRNLILFFDGTGNVIGNKTETNVVKLMRAVHPAKGRQLVYYDPGVGSANDFPGIDWFQSLRNRLSTLKGLALGSGAFENIAAGYRFLVENYQSGDRIFLFGFSRGAFTARAVGGMVNMYGLVQPGGIPLLPTLVQTYFADVDSKNKAGFTRRDFARDIRENFSVGRTPLLHFVGVWDTVDTIGLAPLGKSVRITNPPDVASKRYAHIRHALAIHETRLKNTPRRYADAFYTEEESRARSFDERWFRGVHGDVGGSYAQTGLSDIKLTWMADEARNAGLLLKYGSPVTHPKAGQARHDQIAACSFWVWTGVESRERAEPSLIDTSADPIDKTTPPHGTFKTSPAAFGFGMLLAAAVAILFGKAGWQSKDVCIVENMRMSLIWGQLLAPLKVFWSITCDSTKVPSAIRWDWALLAAYACAMAYPVSWALRRSAPAAVIQGKALTWLQQRAHHVMLGLVTADAVENLLTPFAFATASSPVTYSVLLGMASAVKFVCMAAVGWAIGRGALKL